jgi:hypothetical protein
MHRKSITRLALFPLLPLLPVVAFVGGALATSIEALLRVRRLERRLATPA